MNIRSLTEQYPVVVAGVAIIVLVGAMWLVLRDPVPGGPVDAYWADMESGARFVAPTHPEPEAGPDGGDAVRVHVYACGSCDEPEDEISYAQRTFTDAGGHEEEFISADLDEWFSYQSPAGRAIKEITCPDGSEPRYCMP